MQVKFFFDFYCTYFYTATRSHKMKPKMNIFKVLIFCILIPVTIFGCTPKFDHEITTMELRETMHFLASDSLKGRYPGTPEDSVLTAYISQQMDISGLVLPEKTGLQEVMVEEGYTVTENNRLLIGNNSGVVLEGTDLRIPGFSATDTVAGKLVLATTIPGKVEGKILVLPLPQNLPENAHDAYTTLRSESLKAADAGALAVIYVYDGAFPEIENKKRLPLPVPVVALRMNIARDVLDIDGTGEVFDMISTIQDATVSTGIQVTVMTEVLPVQFSTHNTLGILKGSDPDKSGEYIIIGAHHDHLGTGGRGSSSRRQDTVAIHYGADDNASGVSGVIELSQHLMSRSPDRSFLFTTFAAEEMGLLGSKTLAENPVIDVEKVQAMINLDMIGRLNADRQLQIGGVGTSPGFRQIIDSVNRDYGFSIAWSEAGFGPSDHASFYAKDIPVLFISTGAHKDYHTPDDRADRINYEGMQEVLNFVSDLAYELAGLEEKLAFTMAGPKSSSGSRGREGMITFGLMPDVMYDGNDGMPVSFVTEGKPAAIGGMKGGDIITAVDGKTVGNVYDYMERLSELKEGQSVVVSVTREGETLDLLLKL